MSEHADGERPMVCVNLEVPDNATRQDLFDATPQIRSAFAVGMPRDVREKKRPMLGREGTFAAGCRRMLATGRRFSSRCH